MIDVPVAFSNMTTIEGGTGINSDGKDRREKRIGFWGAFLTTLFCREPTTERSGKQHTPHYQGFPCHEEIEHMGAVYNTINPSSTTSQQETATKLFMRTLYNWTGIIVKSTWHIRHIHIRWYQAGSGNKTTHTTSATKSPINMRISTKPTTQLVKISTLTRSNFAKSLWRAGDISKPDYTTYCNDLHALHQEYLQGKIGPVKLQEGKQELLQAVKKKRFSTSYDHSKKSSNASTPAAHPTFILNLSKHSEHRHQGVARKMKSSHEAPNSQQRRRQKKEHRLVLGRGKVQGHRTAWWSKVHARVRQLLDRKRSAVSVVAGSAQTSPITQRQLPARRRKRKWLSV